MSKAIDTEHENTDPETRVHGGDALTVLRTLPDNSVHAVVTDPPYGLSEVGSEKLTTALTAWVNGDRESVPDGRGFMGKAWDAFVPPPAVWDECLRVLKPGGHMLVFAGSRTVDLMGLSIRLAGFEIRDTLQWLNGAGFPKSLNVAKAIESGSGRPEDIRRMSMGDQYAPSGRGRVNYDNGSGSQMNGLMSEFVPATDAAREWEGWGTALKPAAEPIILARKPLESTVARNVLAHGTGGVNIDGCRVSMSDADRDAARVPQRSTHGYANLGDGEGRNGERFEPATGGRFPANVILSHSETCTDDVCDEGCPVAELDAQSGSLTSGAGNTRRRAHSTDAMAGALGMLGREEVSYGDTGGASRFFPTFRYQAKAPARERPKVDGVSHNTVKPLALMRWLVRLVTPPGGVVLDPFAGTGTTLQAARDEGFHSIGIEREADYWPLIEQRTGVAAEPTR